MQLPVIKEDVRDYISNINNFPVLNKEQEISLITKYRTEKDMKSLQQLILCSLRYVMSVAWKYRWHRSFRDIIQEGNTGLLMAVHKYDVCKNKRFKDYAILWIKAYILDYLMENVSILTFGKSQFDRRLFYNIDKVIDEIFESEEDSIEHLAKTLNLPIDRVRESYIALTSSSEDIDEIEIGGSEVEAEVINENELEVQKSRVSRVVASLSEKEQEVIRLRYYTDPPLSFSEIGQRLGCTKQNASRIEKSAIEKIKASVS